MFLRALIKGGLISSLPLYCSLGQSRGRNCQLSLSFYLALLHSPPRDLLPPFFVSRGPLFVPTAQLHPPSPTVRPATD